MAQHNRFGHTVGGVAHVHVAMANASCHNANQYFVVARVFKLKRFKGEGLPRNATNRCRDGCANNLV